MASLIPNTNVPGVLGGNAIGSLLSAYQNQANAGRRFAKVFTDARDRDIAEQGRQDKLLQQEVANQRANDLLSIQQAQNERAQATALRNKEQAGRNLLKEQNTQKMQGIVMNAVAGNPNFSDKDLAGILEANKDIAHNVDPKAILDLVPSAPKAGKSELFYVPNKEAKLGYSPRMLTRDELPSYGGAISESTFNKQFGSTKGKGTGGGSGGLLFDNKKQTTWKDFKTGSTPDKMLKDIAGNDDWWFGLGATSKGNAGKAMSEGIKKLEEAGITYTPEAVTDLKEAMFNATLKVEGNKKVFNQGAFDKKLDATIASYKANQKKNADEAKKILGGVVSQEQVVQPQQVQRAGGVLSAGQANQIRNEIRSLEEGGIFSSGVTSVAAKEKIDSKYGEGTYDRLKQ